MVSFHPSHVVGGIFFRPLEEKKQFVIGVASSQETLLKLVNFLVSIGLVRRKVAVEQDLAKNKASAHTF
jgi:hypothetical protein